jgi:hypothetical protein
MLRYENSTCTKISRACKHPGTPIEHLGYKQNGIAAMASPLQAESDPYPIV